MEIQIQQFQSNGHVGPGTVTYTQKHLFSILLRDDELHRQKSN